MIYIWDNGHDYSDHGIYFLESSYSAEVVSAAMLTCHGYGRLLGETSSVRWLGDVGSAPMENWLDAAELLNAEVPLDLKFDVLSRNKAAVQTHLNFATQKGNVQMLENAKERMAELERVELGLGVIVQSKRTQSEE